ncbi:Glycerol kinase [Candidatus Methylacidithermus pantelleriae]|uniref:ATP:glycerol 3-phosphotransferase n=2 Tax=Candidatus Methylacidithermus pantelleriae TaxID=2744239 RepID=A0A8J2BMQ9_9BACT|nr:Glycerol kinase [Candidatus Methylacidithermus pantelleriae]
MGYILALDIGTGSARALLVAPDGRVCAFSQRPLEVSTPKTGWVEQDPEELWFTPKECIEDVVSRAKICAGEIRGIGIANQRETIVLWERSSGRALSPAIVWQDRRSARLCQELSSRHDLPSLREKTGLFLDPYFSAPKLMWLLAQHPQWREAALRGDLAAGTVDSWLIWNITQGHCHKSDVSNASRTLLLNIRQGSWDPQLLALFDVPPSLLPRLCPSQGYIGEAIEPACIRGVPILGILGDQQASLFGHRAWNLGDTKCTYGTGAFVLQNREDRLSIASQGLLTTIAWATGQERTYAFEGPVFVAGALLEWLVNNVKWFESVEEILECAAQTPNSETVTFVPSLCGLGSPSWDPEATGILLGLTPRTTKREIARAALEGIAWQIADVCEALQAETQKPLVELWVDGGLARSPSFLQLQTDVLGIPVKCPNEVELTGLGVAYLAGLEAGVWKTHDELESLPRSFSEYHPTVSPQERADRRDQWKKALAKTTSSL